MPEEFVILVDENDNPIGSEEKVKIVIYLMGNYTEHLQHYYLIIKED